MENDLQAAFEKLRAQKKPLGPRELAQLNQNTLKDALKVPINKINWDFVRVHSQARGIRFVYRDPLSLQTAFHLAAYSGLASAERYI